MHATKDALTLSRKSVIFPTQVFLQTLHIVITNYLIMFNIPWNSSFVYMKRETFGTKRINRLLISLFCYKQTGVTLHGTWQEAWAAVLVKIDSAS